MVTFDDFSRLELKTGKILEVSDHPDADKLYVLKVDVGAREIQLVAGIKKSYAAQDLVGKTIAVLVNLEPKTLRGVESCGMLLAARTQEGARVLTCDGEVAPGSEIG